MDYGSRWHKLRQAIVSNNVMMVERASHGGVSAKVMRGGKPSKAVQPKPKFLVTT